MTLQTTQIPRIAVGYRFQWEAAQNCHVLLYPEGMVQLNDTAGVILARVDGQKTLQTIISELESEFSEPDLQADIMEFIQTALQQGWINVR